MRIVVTGGSGKLGRTVVRTLREEGNEVVNLDQQGARESVTRVDLTDYGQVLDAVLGIEERTSSTPWSLGLFLAGPILDAFGTKPVMIGFAAVQTLTMAIVATASVRELGRRRQVEPLEAAA